jgi:hypothetical protein
MYTARQMPDKLSHYSVIMILPHNVRPTCERMHLQCKCCLRYLYVAAVLLSLL